MKLLTFSSGERPRALWALLFQMLAVKSKILHCNRWTTPYCFNLAKGTHKQIHCFVNLNKCRLFWKIAKCRLCKLIKVIYTGLATLRIYVVYRRRRGWERSRLRRTWRSSYWGTRRWPPLSNTGNALLWSGVTLHCYISFIALIRVQAMNPNQRYKGYITV